MYSVSTNLEKGEPGWNVEIARVYLNEEGYVGDDLALAKYLATLRRPEGLTDTEYESLQQNLKLFF